VPLALIFAFSAIVVLLLPVTALYFVTSAQLIREIGKRYPSQYHAMGAPAMWTVHARTGQFIFAGYLLKRKYESIKDPDIARRGDRTRRVLVMLLTLEAVAVLVLAIGLSAVFLTQK
jgi:hypothetical protein